MPCTGDSLHDCGGFWRLQLYLWNGTLNTWKTPANIGRYEVFTVYLDEPVVLKGDRSTSFPASYLPYLLR